LSQDAPNTIVQVTGSPLTDKIPRFLGFKERLIGVNIGDVQQSLSVHFLNSVGRTTCLETTYSSAFVGRT